MITNRMLAHRSSRCDPEPLGTGAASFKRVLGGGENPTPNAGREFDNGKEGGRIEIILTGLIDHPKLAKLLGFPIGNYLVQFPPLKRSLLSALPPPDHSFPPPFPPLISTNHSFSI